MICFLKYFSDNNYCLAAQRKVQKFMNFLCLTKSSFNHFEVSVKQYSIVDGQIHVTLSSTYLFFNNENYSSAS